MEAARSYKEILQSHLNLNPNKNLKYRRKINCYQIPIILARNMADSITLKTSLLSDGEEISAAYVKEAIMKVFLDPDIGSRKYYVTKIVSQKK